MSAQRASPSGGASPETAAAAEWFRDLVRALKISRLYCPANPVAAGARERVARGLADCLARFGAWTFHVTLEQIRLGDHPVVRPAQARPEDGSRGGLLEQLPLLLYRDGIRELTFLPEIPESEVFAFVDALALGWTGRSGADDMVTALWQANPTHIRVEALPAEQVLYLSSSSSQGGVTAPGMGLSLGLPPDAQEIRADLEQAGGPVGLHHDAHDADTPPPAYLDVEFAYQALLPARAAEMERLRAEWKREAALECRARAGPLLRRMLAQDRGEETRAAVARFAVTWVAAAVERAAWEEAREALDLQREADPEGLLAREEWSRSLAAFADESLGDSFDEAEPEKQARFFAFLVALGHAGVPLALAVLAGAARPRTHAAACTALSYLCSDDPTLLAPALADPRPAVVRHVVLVLGQIGGAEVASLLAPAAHHPDYTVRREAVNALAAVPVPERTEILLELLAAPDPRLLPALLRVARLEPNPRLARALLALVEAQDFESRGDESASALFQTLADAGGEDLVPALETMLLRGGWLARTSARRTAAARTLARIGGRQARSALEQGLRARSAAVRAACREALERREAA